MASTHSWVVRSRSIQASVFFNGDTGYFSKFREIKFREIDRRFEPFDIAMMENGAYDKAQQFEDETTPLVMISPVDDAELGANDRIFPEEMESGFH